MAKCLKIRELGGRGRKEPAGGQLCPEKDVCWPSSQVGTATPTVLEACC
jgi:hypothetical protein